VFLGGEVQKSGSKTRSHEWRSDISAITIRHGIIPRLERLCRQHNIHYHEASAWGRGSGRASRESAALLETGQAIEVERRTACAHPVLHSSAITPSMPKV
jgi:hypothetical protein